MNLIINYTQMSNYQDMEKIIQNIEELSVNSNMTCSQVKHLNVNDPQRRYHLISCRNCYRKRQNTYISHKRKF